jgi:hypothetical protein
VLKILEESEQNPSVKKYFSALLNTPSINIYQQLRKEIAVGNVKSKMGMLCGMFHISGNVVREAVVTK